MSVAAIIVAAGDGVRMGAGVPKALIPLAGRPMVAWSLATFAGHEAVMHVVVVAPALRLDEFRQLASRIDPRVRVVAGGATRAHSVRAGLKALPAGIERVLVHDAARPLVRTSLIDAIIDALDGAQGAIAARPVADTIKRAGQGNEIVETVDRRELWAAETPQGFHVDALRHAYAALDDAQIAAATDCASVLAAAGVPVFLVLSELPNLKVTTPADAEMAEHFLGAPQ